MLAAVDNKELTAVFAYDQSRFERNPKVRFIINDIFKKNNIEYYTHVDGKIDLHDPHSEFQGDLLSVINKYHVTMTKIKVKSVLKQRAEEGKSHGILAYGYASDENGYIIIDLEEAQIVKKIFNLSHQGVGVGKIAIQLNESNVPTRYNKIGKGTLKTVNKDTGELREINKSDIKWAPNTILSILKNECYIGKRRFGNEIVQIPSILDELYFRSVQENLKKNRNNTGKKVEHRYLLKGTLRCGVCGRNMYGRSRVSKKDNFYMCSSKRIPGENCGNRSINIDKIEDFIWYTIFQSAGFSKKAKDALAESSKKQENLLSWINKHEKKLEALTIKKNRVLDAYVDGIIEKSDLKRKELDLKKKTNDLVAILSDAKKEYSVAKEVNASLFKHKPTFEKITQITSFKQKQEIIRDFIKRVSIKCDDGMYYFVNIEYNHTSKVEKWQSQNLTAPVFFRLDYVDGEKVAFYSTPPPISDPTNKQREQDFFKKIK